MFLQGPLLSKTFLAYITIKWKVSSMQPHVNLVGDIAGKLLPAHVAFKWHVFLLDFAER